MATNLHANEAMTHDVAVLVGSLRKDSFTRKVANAVVELAPDSLRLEIVEVGNLALYNQDLEARPPRDWVGFRDRIRGADGVVFATPEYNRSIPGVLKNAVDVGSRPYGKSVWMRKPTAIISVSPGALGGFGANHHLRQCCVLTCRACRIPRPTSITSTRRSTTKDGSLAARASSCRNSWSRTPNGSSVLQVRRHRIRLPECATVR